MPNANRFSNFFSDRLNSKFLVKQYLNIPSHLNHVATPPCEMRVLNNRNDPWLNEANFHARRYYLKHLLKNIPKTRMWANAQPDGRPAKHRWRPLFNAAKFG